MTNLFSFIKNQIKPDVVFWTGDSIPHNIESVTFDETVNNMARVSREVADGLKGIPIYAAPGNHDTYPADIFLGHYAQENAAFTEWAKDWDSFSFLKDPEQMKNFNDFGYYSAPLVFANGTQIGKNFSKVISINSNFCYQANFELTA
jgi:predicted MPP superfamily phosphohydrolase